MEDLERAHLARLETIRDRWNRNEISTAEKRQLIETENQTYHVAVSGQVPARLRPRQLPGPDTDAVRVMARAFAAPPEQVRVALDTARQASRDSQYAESASESRRVSREGWDLAQELLHGRKPADGLAEAG